MCLKRTQRGLLPVLYVVVLFLALAATAFPASAQHPVQRLSQLSDQTLPNAPVPSSLDTTSQSSSSAPQASAPNSDDPPSVAVPPDVETFFPHFRTTQFWLSAQANFIFQFHPSFPAAYSGIHSLRPIFESATSRVVTVYTGVRVSNSLEFLADVEEAGGLALSSGFGFAGNTDLDIVRNPSLSKAPYFARGMIHKVIALSPDKVENDRTFLSLFDELPRRRLELRFGKFSMPDFFDINEVGSDTRYQFMNWTIDNNGAWDYAADTRGYTVGFLADYEDRNWGFRFGEGLMPKVANGIDLVWKPWQAHAENYEFELRHGIVPRKTGVIRLLGYDNHANMGIYRDAIINFDDGLTPIPQITAHPWHITQKYGFEVNLQQTLARYLTAYSRLGWDNGKTESFAYTEDDATISGGLSAYGAWWHRTQDRAGGAFVSNGIKKYHQTYLAEGGYGFLLGDGGLTYGRENTVEFYYTLHAWRGIYLGPDLQHINNPGYNRVRGPVAVPSFRVHLEF
ncbi:MAG: carbohydrate porin [Candidatus Sulfotelmatobacter sp.]